MSKRIKNLSKKILSNAWGTLSELKYDYNFKDGTWKSVTRESYNRGNSCAILLYNRDSNSVLLAKQLRMPIYEVNEEEAMSIEACAGVIDKGESPEAAIIREVEEELGYQIERAEQVYEIYTSPGAMTEKIYLFVAPYDESCKVNNGGGVAGENEEIEVMEITFTEALRGMETGKINDAKTIILLQHAKIHKLLDLSQN